MEHIAANVENTARNIELVGADQATHGGFTQVPNFLLKSERVSAGAKLTFARLLHYAWQNDFCFPGQETLANDMGAGKRSIVRFLKELEDEGFIAVKRRGQGKSNLYQLILKPVGWRS